MGGRGSSITGGGGQGNGTKTEIGFTEKSVLQGIEYDQDTGDWYGLRATSDNVPDGGILEQSVNWDMSNTDENGDYNKEEYKLDGSSAVSLGDRSEALDRSDISSLLDQVDSYPGRHVYLVKGTMLGYGSDQGEVILSERGGGNGAKVVKRLK